MATKAMRFGILGVALIVFLGNIMMWVVMPTDIYYLHWLPKILAATTTPYFGIQGPIMMDFTLPIIVIAVLGCIYLHLGKEGSRSNVETRKSRKNWLRTLKKPMIVRGLGIVCWTELALFGMFVLLCLWYFSAYLRHHYAKLTLKDFAASRGDQLWEAKWDRLALVTALTGNLCLSFLFYPVTRGSSVLPMLGLTSEASIKYHTWLGHMAMALFTAHGLLYISFWSATSRLSEMLKWNQHYISNVPGELSLLCGLALWMTTHPRIRRKVFEVFYYTHHLYILFMVFFFLHVGIFFACIMLPGFYLFLIDRYLRFLQSRAEVRLVSARVLPCETVELNFLKSRGLKYNPTSTMFVNVPSISRLQWHPFTVTSNGNLDAETLSVVIKCGGSWTKKLYDMLSSPSGVDHLQVSVEGPYGPATTDFLRHDTLVMVSGGSGITPFISIIRELIFVSSTLKCRTPKILLVSIFKNSTHLSILDLLLPVSGTQTGSSNLDLQIEAYVTREKAPPLQQPEPLRIIRFIPKASDAPISPILGQRSHLWLGAIISASFAIFLLLVGAVTRYYTYPIDHNDFTIYPYSLRALFNMLFICVSIVVAASAAFLWNKKQNDRESKQIQDAGDSPKAFTSDKELESLPHQALLKSTNVHYGQRPDLKAILLENKDSSVGVLASGPKKLRHDVAAICSSGGADNLHFQSISFSW